MKYKSAIVKKERQEIFKLFLNHNKLKFSEIEKEIKIRSNMVSYHLNKMIDEDILEKKDNFYKLTPDAKKYVPIFTNIISEKLSPIAVIVVAIVSKDNEILMIQRNKRPYKNYWSMIGGKINFNENLIQASIRIVNQKTNLDCEFLSYNAILQEKVISNNLNKNKEKKEENNKDPKYNFILFFTKVKVEKKVLKNTTYGRLKWMKINKLIKREIIPSDYWLIQNKINQRLEIINAKMEEKEGKLKNFEIK